MRIAKIAQLEASDLQQQELDVAVVASGFEERARKVAGLLGSSPRRRIALGFEEIQGHSERIKNDAALKRLGYAATVIGGGDWGTARALVESVVEDVDRNGTVLIDISSMTRTWFGAAVALLGALERAQPLRTLFTYVPAAYRAQREAYPQNRVVGPLPAYTGLGYPNAPAALVVGLGHDPERALGIQREIDPGLTATFMADPAADRRYVAACRRANRTLLDDVPVELQYRYPLVDFPSTFGRLDDVSSYLSRQWRVVLTSLGPKIFSLAAFLVAVNNPQVSVWRISAASDVPQIPRAPSRRVVVADVRWV